MRVDGPFHRPGGLDGLEAYVAAEGGLWRYQPAQHSLALERTGDLRQALSCAAGGQEFIGEAPVTIVLIGAETRIEARYGRQRGTRYLLLEAGHAAQNLLLQATALKLGAVPVGAFDDAEVRRFLNLSGGYSPLYLIPVGKPAAVSRSADSALPLGGICSKMPLINRYL